MPLPPFLSSLHYEIHYEIYYEIYYEINEKRVPPSFLDKTGCL